MRTTLRWTMVGLAGAVLAVTVFVAGMALGRAAFRAESYPGAVMMGEYGQGTASQDVYGYGMLGPYGMMGGMMRGVVPGFSYGVEPLSLSRAQTAVEQYLDSLGLDTLVVSEVMVFDNHAYVQVVEEDTGRGAFELLVDPLSLAVSAEPGPNMMWNTKYGHMGGWWGGASRAMSVAPQRATEIAREYLATYLPTLEAGNEADSFYGYYTIHTLRDGRTVGMLSVNGYTGQVWYHSWHGNLMEMTEEGHA